MRTSDIFVLLGEEVVWLVKACEFRLTRRQLPAATTADGADSARRLRAVCPSGVEADRCVFIEIRRFFLETFGAAHAASN
jgi:hypothetical protein